MMTSLHDDVDVVVVGGGTAGAMAAIQAARVGVRTALIEKNSLLGGTMTAGGVDFPGLFHAWGRQIIAGIGWDLVCQAVTLDGRALPDFSKPYGDQHWHHQLSINGLLYAALAESACFEAGVQLCYYECPTDVSATEAGWRVETVGKGVRRVITAKQLIDCTGGADIVGMLGYPRLREATTQPGTLMFRLGGYDVTALDEAVVESRYAQALHDGQLKVGDCKVRSFIQFLRAQGYNAQYTFGADSSNAVTQTHANIAGRQAVLRLLRFIRSLPGCEDARLETLATETGVRETYRIAGETQVTIDDYVSGRLFGDAICYAFYPVDLHTVDGVQPQQLQPGTVPTVPLRALIPKGSANLLVAGRSVSSDRLANSGLRVQAPCMAMGQAAGATAALAVGLKCSPSLVPLEHIKMLLCEHGAIVP